MDKFYVDDVLIMHSPYTDEDTEVVYRGPLGEKAVVYDKKTGWQGAVPVDWLRRKDEGPRIYNHNGCLSTNPHPPECDCEKCRIGDDAYKWLHDPWEY